MVVDIVQAPKVFVSVRTLSATVLLQFHPKPDIANTVSLPEQNNLRIGVGKARCREADLSEVERLDNSLPDSGNCRELTAPPTENWQPTNNLVLNLGR
jgi:hypothetical protein